MFFVTMDTLSDADDFSGFLRGNLKEFNDSMGFAEWVAAYTAFPLKLYINGVVYTLKDRDAALLFQCGFQCALGLLENKEY